MQPDIAKMIYQKVSPLPRPAAQEILDFSDFISLKYQQSHNDLILAQAPSAEALWDNAADDAWNNLESY